MLTGAVCGEVFASPSVEAVLAGILAVTGEAGCLLIVKNYTGDRLNFGLAAERAKALGLKVEMVVVDDDIALPDLPQPRGVAGTLFVHKIAGHLAETGANLDTVAAAARSVIGRVVSIGKSLTTCTIPGSPREDRIPSGKAELGLGIHGEPGVEQVDFQSAAASVSQMLDRLATHAAPGPYALLLNNLGGTTPLEMSVLADAIAQEAEARQIRWMIGPAPMMTSLDMRGVSLSLLPVGEEDLSALTSEAQPAAWPGLAALTTPNIVAMPGGLEPPVYVASQNAQVRDLLAKCCGLMIAAEGDLNALDAKSGDGDTGSTLATAARALEGRLDALPLDDLPALLRAIGTELSQSMGGSSGVLMAIFFSAAGDSAASGANWIAALASGQERIQQVGGAAPGDRTLIDALAPALDALGDHDLAAAASAARTGADATAGITRAKAGRAAYVAEANLAGHNDPGAEAVARLFAGLV